MIPSKLPNTEHPILSGAADTNTQYR